MNKSKNNAEVWTLSATTCVAIVCGALCTSSCLLTSKPDKAPPTGAVQPVLVSPKGTPGSIAEAGVQVGAAKDNVSEVRATLEEYSKKIKEAEDKLSATKAEIIKVENQLKSSNQQLKDGTQGQKQVNTTITGETQVIRIQDKIGVHTKQVDSIDKAVAHSGTIVTEFEKVIGDLDKAKADLMTTTVALASTDTNLRKANADLTAAQTKLMSVEKQLTSTQAELQATRDRVMTLSNADTEKANIINTLNKDKEELGRIIQKKDADIIKAQSAAKTALNKLLIALVGIGVALIGLAVYLGVSAPNPKVISIAAFGLAISITSLTLMFYLDKIILIGLLSAATIAVFLVVQVYIQYKDRAAKEKYKVGLQEVVETTEVAKTKLAPEDVAWMFGDHYTNGQAGIIQNKDTMDLVRDVRIALENKNRPVSATVLPAEQKV